MQLKRFSIVPDRSRATVIAHAPGHDFKASGFGVRGTVELDGEKVVRVEASFPLEQLDAGDLLANRELRKFLELDRRPEARATLSQDGRLTFTIGAKKMEAAVTFSGTAPQGAAKFALTFTGLGYTPPKLLFLKVKDTLEIEVSTALQPDDG